MSEATRIEDVKERVKDFSAALRASGAPELAQRIEGYAAGFVQSTEVRRSVDAIKQQLQHYRRNPAELPNVPTVLIAANRLEDACKDVLRAGVIEPARPSLRAAGKRKLNVITTTLSAGILALLVPFLLTLGGVDLTDVARTRTLPPLSLVQGEDASASVTVLIESVDPAATRGVEFYLTGHCPHDLPRGASCRAAGERGFGDEKLPAYELMLEGQAYGLFVGFAPGEMKGAVGVGRVLLSTTSDSAEGRYELPLSAAFLGYAADCQAWQRKLGRCGVSARGPSERHEDLPVPTVIVDVVRPPPGYETASARRRKSEAAQALQRAEERALRLAGAVQQIKAVLDDTERMFKQKRYELARERIAKLAVLFAPLDALAVTGSEAEPLPEELVGLRARFETEQRELAAFRDQAFEVAYAALNRPRPAGQSEDPVWEGAARKLGISRAYLESIYAEHAEELEARMTKQEQQAQAAKRAAADALLHRCGPMPTGSFNEVKAYLAAMAKSVHVKTTLQECFTPRLSEKSCYSVVCAFEETLSNPDQLIDEVRLHKWTFYLRQGRVVSHAEQVVEPG